MRKACSSLRKFVTAFALAALVTPSFASAQTAPLPSYARPAPQHEQITGTVASFDGKYAMTVNDDRGYVDNVQLREGTIINPTGLRLIEGMRVTVTGYTSGHTFVALQIDTQYNMTSGSDPSAYGYGSAAPAPAPYYGYGGYPYYGYPYYNGYPWYYGAYPWYYPVAAFGLGIAFGVASYYWGGYCCGYYPYYGYRGGYYGYHGGYYGGGYHGGYGGYGGYGGRNPAVPYGHNSAMPYRSMQASGYHGGGMSAAAMHGLSGGHR